MTELAKKREWIMSLILENPNVKEEHINYLKSIEDDKVFITTYYDEMIKMGLLENTTMYHHLVYDERLKKIDQRKREWILSLIRNLNLPSELMNTVEDIKNDDDFLIRFHHKVMTEEYKEDVESNKFLENAIRYSQNILLSLPKNEKIEELYSKHTKDRLILIYAIRMFVLVNRKPIVETLKRLIDANIDKDSEDFTATLRKMNKTVYPEVNRQMFEDLNAIEYIENFIAENIDIVDFIGMFNDD